MDEDGVSSSGVGNDLPKFNILFACAEFPDKSLFFPSRLTKEFLDGQKSLLGEDLYACQYQLDPISKEKAKFRDSWWKSYDRLPLEGDYYLILDPAGDGTTKTTSYTAVVELFIPLEMTPVYVTRAERWNGTDADLIAQIFEWDLVANYRYVGVEMIQLRGLIKTVFQAEELARHQPFTYKLVELKTFGVSKDRRIEQLAGLWATGRILTAVDGMEDLRNEFRRFPKGRFKDLLDALAYYNQVVDPPYSSLNTDALDDDLRSIPRVRASGKGYSTGYY